MRASTGHRLPVLPSIALLVAAVLGPFVPAAGRAAPPAPAAPSEVRLEFAPDAIASIVLPVIRISGGVRFTYGDVVVEAESLVYDDSSRMAVFSGRATLTRPAERLAGERITYELSTGRVRVEQAAGSFAAEGLEGPVQLRASAIEGDRARLTASGAWITTCSLPIDHAHYRVSVSKLWVRPGEELGAEHAVFWESGVPVFYWPYLHFSLRNPRAGRFTPPEIGYESRGGLFVKTALPYMGPGSGYGYVNVNYFERLGLGLGITQAVFDDGRSLVELFAEADRGPQGASHPDVMAGLRATLAAGGGAAGGEGWVARETGEDGDTRERARLSLNADVPAWGMSLSSLASGTRLGGPGGSPVGVAVGDLKLAPPSQGPWRWSAGGRWDLSSLEDRPRSLWTLGVEVGRDLPAGRAVLRIGRETHPDRFDDPTLSLPWEALARLPELDLRYSVVDGRVGPVPVRGDVQVGAGRFVEWRQEAEGTGTGLSEIEDGRLQSAVELKAGPKAVGPLTLDAVWRAEGDAYTSGVRQTGTRAVAGARLTLLPGAYLQGRYTLTTPLGGASPFRFDRMERTETLDVTARAGQGGPLSAGVTSRYDFLAETWQDVRLWAGASSGSWGVTAGSVYDPPSGSWTAVTGGLSFKGEAGAIEFLGRYRPGEEAFDRVAARADLQFGDRATFRLVTEVDPRSGILKQAELSAGWRVLPEWVLAASLSVDEDLGGLQAGELGIALDQDCRTIALGYDAARQQVSVSYRIKAFGGNLLSPAGGEGLGGKSWEEIVRSVEEADSP